MVVECHIPFLGLCGFDFASSIIAIPNGRTLGWWIVQYQFWVSVNLDLVSNLISTNLFAQQTSDLLEELALYFLYNFHCKHSLLGIKTKKKISPKIYVKYKISCFNISGFNGNRTVGDQ